jgi:hypothetical protein
MGATVYNIEIKTNDLKKTFNELVEKAILHYGDDPYNGTISTTSLGANITEEIPANILKNEKKLRDFINDIENDAIIYPRKWETAYIDLGIDHYKAFTPTWKADKETPKRQKGVKTVQKYSYGVKNSRNHSRQYNNLTEAKRDAKEYTKLMKKDITVYQHRSNGEKFKLGEMQLITDGKEYKSARKTKTKTYLPIRKYILFVYAAC